MTTSACEIAVVGAGPYGLAVTSFLRHAGVEARTFGKTMAFWESQMPVGMCLRSSWDASHIADPRHELSLDRYQFAMEIKLERPLPLADFVGYGRWVQQAVVPDLDTRQVSRIERTEGHFRLQLEDGESTSAKRVVLATGLAHFAHRPDQFDGLSPDLVSHSSDHRELSRFRGQRVVVIGGGQSAIESAALLSEAGARVEVIMRSARVRWLSRSGWLHRQSGPFARLLYPPSDVGPPILNQLVARPDVFRLLPRSAQNWVAYRAIRPAASGWLRSRIGEVRVTTRRAIVEAFPESRHVSLILDDGSKRTVDHVLLATGYKIDVASNPILAPSIVNDMLRVQGYPCLQTGFESSVSGLHFVGAAAAWSYGPLFRFVSGTDYAARAVTRRVVGSRSDKLIP